MYKNTSCDPHYAISTSTNNNHQKLSPWSLQTRRDGGWTYFWGIYSIKVTFLMMAVSIQLAYTEAIQPDTCFLSPVHEFLGNSANQDIGRLEDIT